MRIPEGLTEAKLLRIIQKITRTLPNHLAFGPYTMEDMRQEAWILAIAGLEHFDLEFAKEAEPERAVENFLRVHITNRLLNLKEKHLGSRERPTTPKGICAWERRHLARHSLLHPSELDARETFLPTSLWDDILYREFAQRISAKLPVVLRTDFLRMCDGVKLTAARQRRVREAVSAITQEN